MKKKMASYTAQQQMAQAMQQAQQRYQGLLSPQFKGVSYSGTGTVTQPPLAVQCNECDTSFSGGTGGGEAQSRDEAVVAAYANGWYVGKNLKLCLDCRKKITPDNVDEDLLQTDNN